MATPAFPELQWYTGLAGCVEAERDPSAGFGGAAAGGARPLPRCGQVQQTRARAAGVSRIVSRHAQSGGAGGAGGQGERSGARIGPPSGADAAHGAAGAFGGTHSRSSHLESASTQLEGDLDGGVYA